MRCLLNDQAMHVYPTLALVVVTTFMVACTSSLDDESTASQEARQCSPSNPECDPGPDDPPDDPPPGPGDPDPDPPPTEDPACQALVTGSLQVSPASAGTPTGVPMGTPLTLSWDIQLPTTCTASGPITLGGVSVGTSGSMTIAPLASLHYPLQVGSKQVANLLITTKLPDWVRITANTEEQRRL
ncbi:MAG: hypothetical protein WKG01_39555, partial [Kofleriaceae bacterium]